MPKKRQRCTEPSLFCDACKLLKSIGGFGSSNACRQIRFRASKEGKDIVCKGHQHNVLRQSIQRPVRQRKRIQRTGSGHSLFASGRKSNFCAGALKENNRQQKIRRRRHALKRKESSESAEATRTKVHMYTPLHHLHYHNTFLFFSQQNSRSPRLMLRNKRKLGQQFIEAFPAKQRVTSVTTAQQPKQLSGKQARKKIRGAGTHAKGVASLDAATAISLFSPGVKGAYIKKNGYCFEGKWEDVGSRTGADIMNHMVDAVHHLATSFCPNGATGLVQATLSHGAANSTVATMQDYQQWSQTPLVQKMFQEYR